jgi:sulfur relay protein TusB/DsrH
MIRKIIHIINRSNLAAEILSQMHTHEILLISDGVYYAPQFKHHIYIMRPDLAARLPAYQPTPNITLLDFSDLVQLATKYTMITW